MRKVTILNFDKDGSFSQITSDMKLVEAINSLGIDARNAEAKIANASIDKPYVVKINDSSYGWIDNGKESYNEAAKAKALKKISLQISGVLA